MLDEFGAWITLDSVYGFNNNTYTYSSSDAINNYGVKEAIIEKLQEEVDIDNLENDGGEIE